MKLKKVLALSLAVGVCFSFAACAGSNNVPSKDKKGEKVSQEVFTRVMTDGYCCDNISWYIPMDEVRNTEVSGVTYNVVTTGGRYLKRDGDVISETTQTTTVATVTNGDSVTTNESSVDETTYYAMIDGDCYVYTYDDVDQTWERKRDSSYELLFAPSGLASAYGLDSLVEDFCNMDNWTWNKKTGAYEMYGFEVSTLGVTCTIDNVYKFKNGHVFYAYSRCVYGENVPILGGMEMKYEYLYYAHENTTVTLPTIAE